VLIGRQAERERIEALVRAATDGRSGALLLLGEAGIGKTALLRFARERAEEAGMRVLAARGIETEADLAYSGLYDLLGAVLFLSPKTVEHHLGAIYRKLDVRSRTDLARLLSAQGEPAEAAA
jgi:DNA-binding CsgD family transcriptional regulator